MLPPESKNCDDGLGPVRDVITSVPLSATGGQNKFNHYICTMSDFKECVRAELISSLKTNNLTLAAWEGGSAANGTTDPYSDIDLVVVGKDSVESIFDVIESALGRVSSISHKYAEPRCFWPGCYQRVYFLEGAPKHFFVDVAVFLETSHEVLNEFMQPERHGNPVVHFDKANLVKPRPADPVGLRSRHLQRLKEIEDAYPIYKLEVLKSLDRDHPIDAFGFYFTAVVRPLVELMGILYRPYRFDFGLRYLHTTFPNEDQKALESLLFVKDPMALRNRMNEADRLFREVSHQVHQKLQR